MRGAISLLLALWAMPVATARAQHTKRDAAELSAKLDAILRSAYKKPAAHAHHAPLVDGSAAKKPDPPPPPVENAQVAAPAGSLANITVHALRIAFDPDEWPVQLRALPRTPDEVATHLRNLPKSPAEVSAHLRRLDASLRDPHRHQ